MLTITVLALFSFGLGFAVNKNLHLKNQKLLPAPPEVNKPADVLNYLEACSGDGFEMKKFYADIKDMQKRQAIPQWQHTNNIQIPPYEHWKLFLEDMNREENSADKLDVLKHWVDNKVSFTAKEKNIIIGLFNSSAERKAARDLFVQQKFKK